MVAVEDVVAVGIAAVADRLQPLGVRVSRVAASGAAAAHLAGIAAEIGAAALILAGELADAAPELARELDAVAPSWTRAADVGTTRDAPLGVSLARLAIAETGSTMLAEETLEDRAVGMLTKTHVIVVRADAVVPTLVEAAAALREHALRPGGGYATLVTGPSRTADIELSLSLGVQGPERVFVVFVDELT